MCYSPGPTSQLDHTSTFAIILSGITIFTTIQTQDFPDVEGDAATGRMTFPLYAPVFSRWFTLFALLAWSLFYCWLWGIGLISACVFVALGTFVGSRCAWYRDPAADAMTYKIYNVRSL